MSAIAGTVVPDSAFTVSGTVLECPTINTAFCVGFCITVAARSVAYAVVLAPTVFTVTVIPAPVAAGVPVSFVRRYWLVYTAAR